MKFQDGVTPEGHRVVMLTAGRLVLFTKAEADFYYLGFTWGTHPFRRWWWSVQIPR